MSTQSDLGQCYKCTREGVSRPGVIDYSGNLVCRDHYERDRALDDRTDLEYPLRENIETTEVPTHG